MVPLPTFPDVVALLALGLLLAAALTDLAWRRIPNGIAVLVALAGLLRLWAGGGAFAVALLVTVAVFLGAFLLWQRGALGGGDVKLLAAASLLVPPAAVPSQLLAVALAGGVLALLHLALRPLFHRLRPERLPRGLLRREARRIRMGAPLPYGVAIALGTAFILIRQEA